MGSAKGLANRTHASCELQLADKGNPAFEGCRRCTTAGPEKGVAKGPIPVDFDLTRTDPTIRGGRQIKPHPFGDPIYAISGHGVKAVGSKILAPGLCSHKDGCIHRIRFAGLGQLSVRSLLTAVTSGPVHAPAHSQTALGYAVYHDLISNGCVDNTTLSISFYGAHCSPGCNLPKVLKGDIMRCNNYTVKEPIENRYFACFAKSKTAHSVVDAPQCSEPALRPAGPDTPVRWIGGHRRSISWYTRTAL